MRAAAYRAWAQAHRMPDGELDGLYEDDDEEGGWADLGPDDPDNDEEP